MAAKKSATEKRIERIQSRIARADELNKARKLKIAELKKRK